MMRELFHMTDTTVPARISSTDKPFRLAALGTAALALIVLLCVWPYQHWTFTERSSVIGGIIRKAQQDSEWWFCLVTPFLVGWLTWRMRAALSRLPLTGSWLGAPVLAVGMAMFWFGYKADTAYPGYVAGQLITLGLILLLGGVGWLKQMFFPWAFLVFTWPMIPLETVLALPLRKITAQVSGMLLDVIGVDVVREGTGLHSAANETRGLAQGDLFKLDVEEPCSGIRSLFSLMMISALYGWLSLKTWLPRGILFASAIPLAMLGNMVRMVLLAVGSLWFGTEFAIGRNIDGNQEMSFFHSMAGFAVFGVAMAGMFAICTQLEKRLDKRAATLPSEGYPVTLRAPSTWLHLGVVIAIISAGLVVCALTNTSYEVAQAGLKPEMPNVLGTYVSDDQPMTSQEKSLLNEDVQIERRLYAKPERVILSTVVLSGGEKRSLHPPDVCLPAQGWVIGGESSLSIDLGNGGKMSATLMSLYRDVESKDGMRLRIRAMNIFWYLGSDGTSCATYQGHVLKTYLDAIFKNINHRWALVSFFVPIKNSAGGFDDPLAELSALEDTKKFIQELLPTMLVK